MPLLLQEGIGVRRLEEEVEEVKEVKEEEEERNITLTKDLLTEILQELTHYLKEDTFLVLYPRGDRDLCMGAARVMYQQGRPTICRPRSTTSEIHALVPPTVVYLVSLQDTVLEFPGTEWAEGAAPHLVLVLPYTPTSLTLAPSPPVNLCVIYPKGDTLAFAEVFTFGHGKGPLLGAPVWAWVPGQPHQSHPPYRGNIVAPTNFMGHVVRVAVIQAVPYVNLGRDRAGVLHPTGYLVELLKVLQLQLNFTVRWVEAKDGEFGLPSSNGSWTGLVGVLHRGLLLPQQEADVALGSLSHLASRAAVMDFSPHVDYTVSRVLVLKQSEDETIDWLTYVTVFHWSVWLALVAVWAAASVGVVCVSAPEPNLNLYNYLFSFAGAYAQQGSEVQPACWRGRMVFWGLWAGSVLLYASYTALLTSRLAVVPQSRPFRDVKDALTSAGYSIAAQGGSAYLMMIQSKIGFIQETTSINSVLEGNCAFSWEGPKYFAEYTFLGYRKHLPYSNALSAFISRSADMGILDKLKNEWLPSQGTFCASASQTFLQLGFNKVVFAFFMLAVGMGAGMMTMRLRVYKPRKSRGTADALKPPQRKDAEGTLGEEE
ncbi:hypothetical protein O3P69_009644 [Scylla paramamosain]|uniref:Uncharacterized protein n=1 Tax=Scylla paramamosain TaxID=85552 RepID=A0AAW0SVE9_SCYPA